VKKNFELTHFPLSVDSLPPGWSVVALNEILENVQTGFASGINNTAGIGIPHLRPMNISQRGEIDLSDLRYVQPEVGPSRLSKGDILFNNTNSPAWVGKTALVDRSSELAFSNHMTRLRPAVGVQSAFVAKQLHFLCRSGYFEHQCKKHVNQASINSDFLGSQTPFLLPPSDEQIRINDHVANLHARSQAARQALDAVGPLLEQFRQSVLAAAFRGDLTADWRAAHPDTEPASALLTRIRQGRRSKWETSELAKMKAKGKYASDEKWRMRYQEPEAVDDTELPDLPDGWCWTSIGELAIIDSGEAFKKSEYADAGLRLLQIANVSFGTTLWKEQNYLPLDFAESHTELVLNAGEIVLALNRPIISDRLKVARITVSDLPAILYQRVGRLRPAIDSVADYLFLFVCGPTMLTEVRQRLQGTDQPYLNTSLVPQIAVPLPPLAEQMQIVRFISEQLRSVTSAASCVSDSMNLLNGLDQSILSKAFRGELVPQDPSDEPASELLSRIRAVRSSAQVEKAPRKQRTQQSI
jgi:type I restriction enzyme S subunit